MLGKHLENAALSCSNWEFTLQNGKIMQGSVTSDAESSFLIFTIFSCVGIFLYIYKYMCICMYIQLGFFLFYVFPHYIQCSFMFTLICTFIIHKDNIRQKRRRR